jgi:DNA-binding response OmpR family regulator
MANEIKFTEQELNIINYLENRTDQEVAWEELPQFAKDPANVKLKTIQRAVSEIKRKFATANLPPTFEVRFKSLVSQPSVPTTPPVPQPQVLVQIKRTPAGNIIPADNTRHVAQIDFDMDTWHKRVKTRNGPFQLNDSEWEVFKYFHANPGRLIGISELRDKVVYPNYGAKLPARWFDAIMRIVNHMRRQVIGLDGRLLTVKGPETTYLFQ